MVLNFFPSFEFLGSSFFFWSFGLTHQVNASLLRLVHVGSLVGYGFLFIWGIKACLFDISTCS